MYIVLSGYDQTAHILAMAATNVGRKKDEIVENAIFFFGVDCVLGSAETEFYNQPSFVLPFGLLLSKEKEPFAFHSCIRLYFIFFMKDEN